MKIFDKDAYILAFVTGLLYTCACLNSLAKANFYDLPLDVIPIDIFGLTGAALIIFYGVFCLVGPIFVLSSKKFRNKHMIIFLMMSVSVIICAFYWYATFYTGRLLSLLLTIPFAFFTIRFFYKKRDKFLRHSNTASIEIDSDEYEEAKFKKNSDINGNVKEISKGWIVKANLIVAGFLIVLSYVLPYSHWIEKTDYDVFQKKKDENYAVIISNNDTLIAKEVINGRLGKGYYIFKVEGLSGVEINNVDIRNLTP